MPFELSRDPDLTNLIVAAIELTDVKVENSSVSLRQWCDSVSARVAQEDAHERQSLRQAVRAMLRHGKFKASGRSKPAQEYLLRCVSESGSLPQISAPVDVLNCVSLDCELPISLLSLRKCSNRLLVRRGFAGESYVFNSAGQVLDVTDLVVTCDMGSVPARPVGSPIKDSMAGKIESTDTNLIAIVYAPRCQLGQQFAKVAIERLSNGFQQFCCAAVGMTRFIDGDA